MVNPCFCGCSLKTATLAIAIVDMIMAGFSTFVVFILGCIAINNAVAGIELSDQLNSSLDALEPDELLYGTSVLTTSAIFGGFMFFCLLRFYFGLVLKRASDEEDKMKCKIWMVSSAFFIFVSIAIIVSNYFLQKDVFESVGQGIGIVYMMFGMWVVYEFIQEIKTGKVCRTDSMV